LRHALIGPISRARLIDFAILRLIGQYLAIKKAASGSSRFPLIQTGGNMASNLITARSLIQADLDHARSVLGLWTHQVEELEKALAQIDAVGSSRDALRVQYQGAGARAPVLQAPTAAAPENKPRRGRKPKNTSDGVQAKGAASESRPGAKRGRKLAERNAVSEARSGKSGKPAAAGKAGANRAAKYKDPNSDKTWSGLGRRPGWFVGAPEQYAMQPSARTPANAAQAPTPAGQQSAEAAST
jgi:hypothetical protein